MDKSVVQVTEKIIPKPDCEECRLKHTTTWLIANCICQAYVEWEKNAIHYYHV
jgi:hypothetical protein